MTRKITVFEVWTQIKQRRTKYLLILSWVIENQKFKIQERIKMSILNLKTK